MGAANAKFVNSGFEKTILLKNQQSGMITWAKKITGIKEPVKRDIISKIERMTDILQPENQQAFLGDLVSQRLGVDVTIEEAGKIADMSKAVTDTKALIKDDMPKGSKERIDYGLTLTGLKEYVGDLKSESKALTAKEFLTSPSAIIQSISGATKSFLASMDNSFFGRQGLVSLINQPKAWGNAFVKSWGDMGKELKGIDAITPIKADIFSRPNALNGKYQAMKLDIGIDSEEAFPSSLPERIPLLGRLYKASESAFNGAALRLRADIADRIIEEAEAMGVDVKDNAEGIGKLVNSMTGRGAVQLTEGQAKFVNATIFSVRYFKSQVDVLTAHMFDKNVGAFAKKKAAKNLMKLIGVIGGILGTAKMLDPDSVELDPRSTNFGKIMVGENRDIKVNITAGFNTLITLASRIVPTMHNGKWGFWKKTSKGFVNLGEDKYGIGDPSDVIADFIKGKASPAARILLNIYKGKTYEGEKVTLKTELLGVTTPIALENIMELLKSSAGADPFLIMLLSALDLLGTNINVSQKKYKLR